MNLDFYFLKESGFDLFVEMNFTDWSSQAEA